MPQKRPFCVLQVSINSKLLLNFAHTKCKHMIAFKLPFTRCSKFTYILKWTIFHCMRLDFATITC